MFDFLKRKEKTSSVKPIKNDLDNMDNKTEFEKSIVYANEGNIFAATHVGISYHYGIEEGDTEYPAGIEPDYELAVKYLTIAAKRGNLMAQTDLGTLYYNSTGKEKGLEWLTIAAKRGDGFSQFILACSYRDGNVVEKNPDKAYQWYLESANNGQVASMKMLGEIYRERTDEILNREDYEEYQEETWMNAELSFKWYKMAADNGDGESMYYTGANYYAGYGVESDRKKSSYYMDMAIENGIDFANDFKQEYLM